MLREVYVSGRWGCLTKLYWVSGYAILLQRTTLYGGRLWEANMIMIGVGGVQRRSKEGMVFVYGSISEQVGIGLPSYLFFSQKRNPCLLFA